MPTVQQNYDLWSGYDWAGEGHEWSEQWGGTELMWWGTLLPRIHPFVPAGNILEIAPGFGRWTSYLRPLCETLTLVDLSERCIEACKARFSGCSNITYFVNDGRSLDMVPDGSVDFVFSFDSLVHADSDVIGEYLAQLARKLTPEGAGFIHHSNVGAYLLPLRRRVPKAAANRVIIPISRRVNKYWRGEDMTADLFDQFCASAGLQCIGQEVVNWGGPFLTDCFSTFTLKTSVRARPRRVVKNRGFMQEARRVSGLGRLYGAR